MSRAKLSEYDGAIAAIDRNVKKMQTIARQLEDIEKEKVQANATLEETRETNKHIVGELKHMTSQITKVNASTTELLCLFRQLASTVCELEHDRCSLQALLTSIRRHYSCEEVMGGNALSNSPNAKRDNSRASASKE